MACRTEFGPSQPFKGARISGSLHMTIHAALLIETDAALVLVQHLLYPEASEVGRRSRARGSGSEFGGLPSAPPRGGIEGRARRLRPASPSTRTADEAARGPSGEEQESVSANEHASVRPFVIEVQYSDGVTFFRVQRSKIVLISSSTTQSLGSAEEEHQQHGQRSNRS
ncbi:hypothetical protein ZWY2020_059111 [Hordeum vulgare]|nr:hypothetical protein ZWY2020_059111 [Hordeum vulgare]